MSALAKSRLLKYGLSGLFCAAAAAGIAASRGVSEATLVEQYRILSDAFFIPGIVLILAGLLVFVANEGALNGISYVMKFAVKFFASGGRMKHERYSDYVARKSDKKVTGFGFLFLTGAVSMGISIIFLVLFYTVFQG